MSESFSKMKTYITFFFLTVACLNTLLGVDRIWTNATTNNLWSEPLNWIPFGVPEPGDSVNTFYSDDLILPSAHSASIKYIKLLGSLTIEAGASLTITDGHFNCNGDLINHGSIEIYNSPTYGLKHSSLQANSRPITNYGTIFIDNSAQAGLWVRYDQTFSNEEGGLVEITHSGEASIELLGAILNRGVIKAENSMNGVSLLMEHEESTLVNRKCAKINLRDQMLISNGSLSSFGFFRQNFNGQNVISDDLFTNYGLLEDIFKSTTDGSIINIGIWIRQYDNVILEGEPVIIFDNQFPLDAMISSVYLEKELTTLAGPYDYFSNTWIPNGNAAGNSSFFVEVSQDNGNCFDTIRFDVTSDVEGVNFWKGGSGDWDIGANWNYGTVPESSDRVGIYNQADEVNIPVTFNAFAKDVILKGRLKISEMASLSVDDPSVEHGIEIRKGELLNNGTIEIKNADTGIHISGSVVVNNGDIHCIANSNCIESFYSSDIKSVVTNNLDGAIYSDSGRMINLLFSLTTNYGTMDAQVQGDDTAMEGDSILNYGMIKIRGDKGDDGGGLFNDFVNYSSGTIHVSMLDKGVHATGENYGNIYIDTCYAGMLITGGNFINHNGGKIEINQNVEALNTGVREFYNDPDGHVMINKSEIGIIIFALSDLYNKGLIEIDSSLTYGMDILGDLYNELTGQIIIDRGQGVGLNMERGSKIYCQQQSRIEILRFEGEEILLDECDLMLEGNSVIEIVTD